MVVKRLQDANNQRSETRTISLGHNLDQRARYWMTKYWSEYKLFSSGQYITNQVPPTRVWLGHSITERRLQLDATYLSGPKQAYLFRPPLH